MIIDANDYGPDQTIEADICIVGAGAAGIAIASEFIHSTIKVVIIESGRFSSDSQLQTELFSGEVEKGSRHPRADLYRRRMIGGTTSVWGGRCVPFDGIDFERRDYIPYSGWPLTRDELLPYYQRANPFCEAGVFDYCSTSSLGADAGEMIPGFVSLDLTTTNMERFSLPTHFGRRYRATLQDAPNVSLIYNATCTSIRLDGDGRIVEKLVFRNSKGRSLDVRARQYVLAMGGLETTRLLLSSSDIMPDGIGNHSDKLGRFYMCHLASNPGELKISPSIRNVIYGYEKSVDGIYCRRRIALPAETQRRHKIGNMIARFIYPNAADPGHGNGILSMLFLTRSVLQPEYRGAFSFGDALAKPGQHKVSYRAHLKNALFDLPQTLLFSQMILRKRFLAKRKLPSVVLKSKSNTYPLDLNVEQSPEPTSRLTLTGNKDVFGMPKLRIDWRTNDVDKHTVRTGVNILREAFQKSGCAELTVDEGKIDNYWPVGGHHIGTTRMTESVKDGVVDKNCRVHGIGNLYIASSSVFPTSSHANPTLTIVALAMRLADHLKHVSE